MEAKAYRNRVNIPETISEVPLQEFKELAKQIELRCLHAKRLLGQYSSPNVEIDRLTSDWPVDKRERFRYWFRNTREVGNLLTAENKMETRQAQYLPYAQQEKIDSFKEKRRSMVRRLRRLQNEIGDLFDQSNRSVDWSDERYPSPEKKLEAIQTALNQICVLLSTLRTKEVTAAAITRTQRFLQAADNNIATRFASIVNEYGGMTRVAANAPVLQVAKRLKEELDSLNYGKHLRRLYSVYEALYHLKLPGIASMLEEVIQKELSNLSGIYKKVSEVYSELLKIPSSQLPDEKEEVEVKPIGEEQFKQPEDLQKPEIPIR